MLGMFYVIFEWTSKKVNTKFPGWGCYFAGTAFNDELNGTKSPPKKIISKKYSENKNFLCYFWKNIKRS